MPQLALRTTQASADASADADHDLSSPLDESPTAGRLPPGSNSVLSSAGSLPSQSSRSPRMPMPSPLSTTSNLPPGSSNASPRQYTSSTDVRSRQVGYARNDKESEHTTFYSESDSSGPPSPVTSSPRIPIAKYPNDSRAVSDPVTSTPTQGLPKPPRPPMAGPVAVAQGEAVGLPRNSSMDSAISAVSLKGQRQNVSQDGQNGTPDIANLIKTAGSAEAVIQYLLKEKHSQAQQSNQLWRLVDKQRAMILGLNKDLERALQDKEKYRNKLKEVLANPAVSRVVGAEQRPREPGSGQQRAVPRVDVSGPKGQTAIIPESPTLDSLGGKNSPIDVSMAPYPITPPADQIAASSSAVSEALDPSHAMPKHQEHALGKFDHEAEEKTEAHVRKQRNDELLKEIPFNVSLPPSRSLPSIPPKMPPPKPPAPHLPTVAVVEATPQPDEGLSSFPAPPRKAPPAPLQLKRDLRPTLIAPPDEEDTDSDYDDILDVNPVLPEKRGRRRTRAEDDREREILALKEAEARSTSKKSKSSQPPASNAEMPSETRNVAPGLQQSAGAISLAGVLHGDKPGQLTAPLMSPGLPASPRPLNMKAPLNSPPLSPRTTGAFPAVPLSPRPPRQAIPMPPNTPLATPAVATSGDGSSSPRPLNIAKKGPETAQPPSPAAGRGGTMERTQIYKGLVTEEYPDLLLPPNALPSIQIRVASSRMKPSRASLLSLTQLEEDPVFTLAVISRADGGELWRVEKDSASLAKLDQRLKQASAFTAKTPDRSLFSGHSPAKLDARRFALENYMDEVLNTPLDAATAVELCKYLSTHTLPPNADETGSTSGASPEGGHHKLGPDGRPHKSGYLTKKGKNFGGWKARFFVLDGPQLRYFETPGGAHLGTIKLPNAQIGKQAHSGDNQSPSRANGDESDHHYRHAFLILEPKKKDSNSHVKHVLCAESDRERDLWVDALLQWIDYRDPDEIGPSSSRFGPPDRQMSGGSERQGGGKSKKSTQPKGQHHPSDSDTLVGMRYDSTNAGDTPYGAPNRPKTSGGLPEHPSSQSIGGESISSQSSKTMISGPKDLQVISDSAAWGSKVGLAIPTNDEKKQRKRSFFGFGPKARSSSDGQDSLFGGSEAGSGATPPQNSYQGPVRQVFGAPLAEAVRYNPPGDVDVPLPSVVFRCIQYLDDKNAVLEEGIFRLSGSNVIIKQLRERFNTEGDLNLVTDEQYYDIHAVASLLKLYLRELPTTILTRDLHLDFLSATELPNRTEKLQAMNELAQRLPLANSTLLKYLIAFLIKIINNADVNKMTVRNVGIVFSPTLNIPAPVFATFLQNYEEIFGIDPGEYELPSPVSAPGTPGPYDGPMRFEPPPRPSTSSGSASPHRQMRMESARDNQRMTPTPPLMNFNGPRASPTPPLVAARQPSETGYAAPAAYDRQAYQPYQDDQGSDQSYGSNSRRRESAVFMGSMVGLQHQGSKSRLREETRF